MPTLSHMKKILLFAILVFCSTCIYAQDVEGVEIGTKMTYEQVVEKFGEPDEVEIQEECEPECAQYRYYYGISNLLFSEDDGLIGFSLRDKTFNAIMNYIEGGLNVGDSLSQIQNVNINGPLEKYKDAADGSEIYKLFSHTDCPLWLWAKDGIITYIWLSIPL